MVEFKTRQDAINAGYICVNKRVDKDISGYPYFGYDFENDEGNKTVNIFLSEVRNSIGDLGTYTPMFPPK